MKISSAALYLLNLPLQETFSASHGDTSSRIITVVQLTTDQGIGWGECSALPAPTYTSEWAAGAFAVLADELVPLILNTEVTSGTLDRALRPVPGHPMAKAGLEMAILDVELRQADTSLAQWLGVSTDQVPAGVSLGLADLDTTVARAVSLAEQGFGRLKAKIEPGHDLELVRDIRRALPNIELQVDANGAYGSDDLDLLVQLAGCNIRAIEQPFAPQDFELAAELIGRLADEASGVLVVADESVSTMADAESLVATGSLTGLSIKPARVGGLGQAKALHDFCVANGVAATAGGMLETGLGRHALAAFAGLSGFKLIGDLSPAQRWLAADPWPDIQMIGGHIVVPSQAGIAPLPNEDQIDRYSLEHRVVGQL